VTKTYTYFTTTLQFNINKSIHNGWKALFYTCKFVIYKYCRSFNESFLERGMNERADEKN